MQAQTYAFAFYVCFSLVPSLLIGTTGLRTGGNSRTQQRARRFVEMLMVTCPAVITCLDYIRVTLAETLYKPPGVFIAQGSLFPKIYSR
jgi:hypothetical protein